MADSKPTPKISPNNRRLSGVMVSLSGLLSERMKATNIETASR
jgi:hypothetical protein